MRLLEVEILRTIAEEAAVYTISQTVRETVCGRGERRKEAEEKKRESKGAMQNM